MSRKSNLRHELIQCLRAQDRRGESKFDAKQEAKAAGGKYEQVTGIYSTSTFNTYSRSVADFAEYVVERDRYCRSAEDAQQYIDDYHAHLVDKGYSAWTVRTRVMGVLRAYGLRARDLARPLPARRTADITRTDRGKEYIYKSSERRSHAERIRRFVQATGCRKGELMRLRPEDIRKGSDGYYEVYRRCKGGIKGWRPTVKALQDAIDDMLSYKNQNPASMSMDKNNGEKRLFSRAEYDRINVHAYRGDYAKALYAEYCSEGRGSGVMYYCRGARRGEVYDRGVLSLVSEALAHHRVDVVVAHYLIW